MQAPQNPIDALVGQFTFRMGTFETLIDELLVQSANHYRGDFFRKYTQLPWKLENKAEAVHVLLSDFLKRTPDLSQTEFETLDGFRDFFSELSQIRNALFHSMLSEIGPSSDGQILELFRYGKGEKSESGRTYSYPLVKLSRAQIEEANWKLEEGILVIELTLHCLSEEWGSWNEREISRPRAKISTDLGLQDRILRFARGKDPFQNEYAR